MANPWSPPPYEQPLPWDLPYIDPNDPTDVIVHKYQEVLGVCKAQAGEEQAAKIGVVIAGLLLSLLPFLRPIGSLFSPEIMDPAMDMMVGGGSDTCYKDSYEEYMHQFVYGAISERYLDNLQNILQGYQERVKYIIEGQELEEIMSLRRDMIGDQAYFLDNGDHKRLAIIPARDYINLRLSLYLDERGLDTDPPKQDELKNIVKFMVKGIQYVKEAIHLAGEHMKTRITDCRRSSFYDVDGLRPNCTLNYEPLNHHCDCPNGVEGDPHPAQVTIEYCRNGYSIYFVPGLEGAEAKCGRDGYKWVDEATAQKRGYDQVVGEFNTAIPYDQWKTIRDKLCEEMHTQIEECSTDVGCGFEGWGQNVCPLAPPVFDPNNPNNPNDNQIELE